MHLVHGVDVTILKQNTMGRLTEYLAYIKSTSKDWRTNKINLKDFTHISPPFSKEMKKARKQFQYNKQLN